MKAYLTVGVSGSGKSTWSMEKIGLKGDTVINVIERDYIRKILKPHARGWWEFKYSKALEKEVTEIEEAEIARNAELGYDIILSNTNLNKKHREKRIKYLESLGYEVVEVPMIVDYETAWKRNENRQWNVSRDTFNRQWKMWIEYAQEKGIIQKYKPDHDKLYGVIFDLDGTLADNSWRNPYDFHLCEGDKPIEEVINVLRMYDYHEYYIVILSGRDESCEHQTMNWLEDNNIPYDKLIMRKAGDKRKDSIVKQELFFDWVEPYYDIKAVYDDRNQVVRMWNDIGIPKVFNVGDFRNEF